MIRQVPKPGISRPLKKNEKNIPILSFWIFIHFFPRVETGLTGEADKRPWARTASAVCPSVCLPPCRSHTHLLRLGPGAVWEATALLTRFCPFRSPGVYVCGGTGGDLGLLSRDSTDRGFNFHTRLLYLFASWVRIWREESVIRKFDTEPNGRTPPESQRGMGTFPSSCPGLKPDGPSSKRKGHGRH